MHPLNLRSSKFEAGATAFAIVANVVKASSEETADALEHLLC